MNNWIKIASLSEIFPDVGKRFLIGERYIAVFLAGGEYYAIDDTCPHANAPLSEGPVEDHAVICPWHAALFDLRDGSLIEGPCLRGVTSYPTRIENDELWIQIEQ